MNETLSADLAGRPVPRPSHDAAETRMPADRLRRSYLVELRYELRRTLRMPGFTLPFLLLPAVLYLFFAVVLGGKITDPVVVKFLFLGFSVFGVMGPGMFGFGIFVATEREQGLVALKRAMPSPPGGWLVARMAMAMLFAAAVMATMIAAGLVGHVPISPGRLAAVFVIDVLGALPFCAIGLFIGTLASARSAPGWVNLAYLPMMYLGGLWFPLPKAISWVMLLSPAFHVDQLTFAVSGMPTIAPPEFHLAVLATVTVLFSFLALRRLSRVG